MAIYEKETYHSNPSESEQKGATIEKDHTIDDGTFYAMVGGDADPGWKTTGSHVDEKGGLIVELEKDGIALHMPKGLFEETQSRMRELLTKIVKPGEGRSLGDEALSSTFRIPTSPELGESDERTHIHVIDPDAGKTYDIDVSHREK